MAIPHRKHRRRLRDAARHQPPRPLRADRAAAGAPARHAARARRQREQLGAPARARSTSTISSSSAATASGSAYSQSKLANLLFAFELDRRLRKAGASTISVAAHPGYAATNLQTVGSKMEGSKLSEQVFEFGNRLFAQSAAMGALPTLYAATAPAVQGGDYFGPDRFFEIAGGTRARSARRRARRTPPTPRASGRSPSSSPACASALA